MLCKSRAKVSSYRGSHGKFTSYHCHAVCCEIISWATSFHVYTSVLRTSCLAPFPQFPHIISWLGRLQWNIVFQRNHSVAFTSHEITCLVTSVAEKKKKSVVGSMVSGIQRKHETLWIWSKYVKVGDLVLPCKFYRAVAKLGATFMQIQKKSLASTVRKHISCEVAHRPNDFVSG